MLALVFLASTDVPVQVDFLNEKLGALYERCGIQVKSWRVEELSGGRHDALMLMRREDLGKKEYWYLMFQSAPEINGRAVRSECRRTARAIVCLSESGIHEIQGPSGPRYYQIKDAMTINLEGQDRIVSLQAGSYYRESRSLHALALETYEPKLELHCEEVRR